MKIGVGVSVTHTAILGGASKQINFLRSLSINNIYVSINNSQVVIK